MKKNLLFITFFAFTLSSSAYAEIYKRIGSEGRVIYSNIKTKDAVRLEIDPNETILSDTQKKYTGGAPSANSRTPTPQGFPRVDQQTQNQRDGKRKEILQNELNSEKSALEIAKKTYAEAAATPKSQEKMQNLQADIGSHENNIKLLQKEIDNLH